MKTVKLIILIFILIAAQIIVSPLHIKGVEHSDVGEKLTQKAGLNVTGRVKSKQGTFDMIIELFKEDDDNAWWDRYFFVVEIRRSEGSDYFFNEFTMYMQTNGTLEKAVPEDSEYFLYTASFSSGSLAISIPLPASSVDLSGKGTSEAKWVEHHLIPLTGTTWVGTFRVDQGNYIDWTIRGWAALFYLFILPCSSSLGEPEAKKSLSITDLISGSAPIALQYGDTAEWSPKSQVHRPQPVILNDWGMYTQQLTLTFNGSFCEAGYDGDDPTPVTTWIWDWGDGTMDATSNPSITHSYSEKGVYTITLTVIAPPIKWFHDSYNPVNSITTNVYIGDFPTSIDLSSRHIGWGPSTRGGHAYIRTNEWVPFFAVLRWNNTVTLENETVEFQLLKDGEVLETTTALTNEYGIAVVWVCFYTHTPYGVPDMEVYQLKVIYNGIAGHAEDVCEVFVFHKWMGGNRDVWKCPY